jgi:CRISPR-associated protein Cas1
MHTLSITEQGITLHAEGNLLVLARGKAVLRRVRAAEIDQVLLFGRVEISSGALALLARRDIDCVWLRQDGRFRARLATRSSANVPLRLAQYRATTDGDFCARNARAVVVYKLRYQRQVLLRAQRRLADNDLAVVLGQIRLLVHQAEREGSIDRLRGLEGQGAALYFSQFGKLLRVPHFSFTHRNRRPPRDPVNACLSFGYAVLGSLIESLAARSGLDPTLGFFHQPAYGRPSLALDVLEEFRPLVDGLVLRLLNRRQLGPNDFERRSSVALEDALAGEGDAALDAAGHDGDSRHEEQAFLRDGDPTGAQSEIEDPKSKIEVDDGFDDFAGWAADDRPAPASAAAEGEPPAAAATVGVYLAETGRRIFLSELFRRLRERVYYPPRAGAWELRGIITQQLYHLARVIDGRDAEYVPFVPDG